MIASLLLGDVERRSTSNLRETLQRIKCLVVKTKFNGARSSAMNEFCVELAMTKPPLRLLALESLALLNCLTDERFSNLCGILTDTDTYASLLVSCIGNSLPKALQLLEAAIESQVHEVVFAVISGVVVEGNTQLDIRDIQYFCQQVVVHGIANLNEKCATPWKAFHHIGQYLHIIGSKTIDVDMQGFTQKHGSNGFEMETLIKLSSKPVTMEQAEALFNLIQLKLIPLPTKKQSEWMEFIVNPIRHICFTNQSTLNSKCIQPILCLLSTNSSHENIASQLPSCSQLPLHVQHMSNAAKTLASRSTDEVYSFIEHLMSEELWFHADLTNIKVIHAASMAHGYLALAICLELKFPKVIFLKVDQISELKDAVIDELGLIRDDSNTSLLKLLHLCVIRFKEYPSTQDLYVNGIQTIRSLSVRVVHFLLLASTNGKCPIDGVKESLVSSDTSEKKAAIMVAQYCFPQDIQLNALSLSVSDAGWTSSQAPQSSAIRGWKEFIERKSSIRVKTDHFESLIFQVLKTITS